MCKSEYAGRAPHLSDKTATGEARQREGLDYLTVEDIFRGGLLVLHVPHQGHAVGLMRSLLVVVVGGDQEFRILMAEKGQIISNE